MKKIAIIPARSGSKRIPNKNIKEFLGKPIISYSIETAINSKLFDEIMVSTDCDKIKKIAQSYGAKVPFLRSAKISNDYASTLDVINEVIENYKINLNESFNYACCIYPTAPFVTAHQLDTGLELISSNQYTTVFPAVAYSHPIWRGFEIENKNNPKMIFKELISKRTQDLTTVYHDAGQWYWIDLKKNIKELISESSGCIIVKETEIHDIDNPDDWKIAEIKYKSLKS